MLKIRLSRIGKKNQCEYRVVLIQHLRSAKGKAIEVLGYYNPRKKVKQFEQDRIKYWINKGAKLTPTVHNLLVSAKIISLPKIKIKIKKEKKAKATPPSASAEPTKESKTIV